jgi:hypothetical protein
MTAAARAVRRSAVLIVSKVVSAWTNCHAASKAAFNSSICSGQQNLEAGRTLHDPLLLLPAPNAFVPGNFALLRFKKQ